MTMIIERVMGVGGAFTDTTREMTPAEEAEARVQAAYQVLKSATVAQVQALSENQFRRVVLKALKAIAAMAVEDE